MASTSDPSQPGELRCLIPLLQLRKLRLRELRGVIQGDSGHRSRPDLWDTRSCCPSPPAFRPVSQFPSQVQKAALPSAFRSGSPRMGGPTLSAQGSHRLPFSKPVGAAWRPTRCPYGRPSPDLPALTQLAVPPAAEAAGLTTYEEGCPSLCPAAKPPPP